MSRDAAREIFIVLFAVLIIPLLVTLVGYSIVGTPTVEFCETTISDTGSVERCWEEKEIVN